MEIDYNAFVYCRFSYIQEFKHCLWFSVSHGSETAQQFPQQTPTFYCSTSLTASACDFSTNHTLNGVFF